MNIGLTFISQREALVCRSSLRAFELFCASHRNQNIIREVGFARFGKQINIHRSVYVNLVFFPAADEAGLQLIKCVESAPSVQAYIE